MRPSGRKYFFLQDAGDRLVSMSIQTTGAAKMRKDRSVSDELVRRNSMTKGEQTRKKIVEAAAPIFNQRGYEGSSLNDLMEATGLKKGGIYRHFTSKEELAVEAFDYTSAAPWK